MNSEIPLTFSANVDNKFCLPEDHKWETYFIVITDTVNTYTFPINIISLSNT